MLGIRAQYCCAAAVGLCGAVTQAPKAVSASVWSPARAASQRFASLAAGNRLACGIRSASRTLVCWGEDNGGEASPPLGRFVSLSLGGSACAVRVDGSLNCWGRLGFTRGSFFRKTGQFTQAESGFTAVCGRLSQGYVKCWGKGPEANPPRTGVSTISLGGATACAVASATEAIICWGSDSQLRSSTPHGKFVQVAVGGTTSAGPDRTEFACALGTDSKISCWGDGDQGQMHAPMGAFTELSASQSYACALNTSGAITCWGRHPPTPTRRYALATAGVGFFCALDASGAATCTGDNTFGQQLAPAAAFAHVASAGGESMCALRSDGSLACAGTFGDSALPTGRFSSISVSPDYACAIRAGGRLLCWGQSPNYQPVTAPSGDFKQVSVSPADAVCAVRSNNQLKCWGNIVRPPTGPFIQVSAGVGAAGGFGCGVRRSGAMACWGNDNGYHNKPDGQTKPPPGSYTEVSAAFYGSCGLRQGGNIACWGDQAPPPRGRFVQISATFSWFGQEGIVCGLRPYHQVQCGRGVPAMPGYREVSDLFPNICGITVNSGVRCTGELGTLTFPAAAP